jgi:hypothetical protein
MWWWNADSSSNPGCSFHWLAAGHGARLWSEPGSSEPSHDDEPGQTSKLRNMSLLSWEILLWSGGSKYDLDAPEQGQTSLSDLAFVIRFAVNDVIRWVLEILIVWLFGICGSFNYLITWYISWPCNYFVYNHSKTGVGPEIDLQAWRVIWKFHIIQSFGRS